MTNKEIIQKVFANTDNYYLLRSDLISQIGDCMNLAKKEVEAINFTGSSLELKDRHKRMIEECEEDLKAIHQDEDFRLDDNSEWSKQLGFIEGKLTVLQTL